MNSHFSLSQARLANSCPLAWRYRYQDGIEGKAGLAAEQGSDMDTLLNGAFTAAVTGYNLSAFDEEVVNDFLAVLDVHPVKEGEPQVGILVDIPGIPIPVKGVADLVTPSAVWEHKRGGGWDAEWWNAARRQVALYAHALDKKWGGIVQVKAGRVHIEQFQVTPDLVRCVHDELRAGWKATTMPATPGKACAWCDYEPSCPSSVFRGLK